MDLDFWPSPATPSPCRIYSSWAEPPLSRGTHSVPSDLALVASACPALVGAQVCDLCCRGKLQRSPKRKKGRFLSFLGY